MLIERLPQSSTESPALYGAVDLTTGVVKWTLDDDQNFQREDYQDGTNWFQVWRMNDQVMIEATQWYHEKGCFAMRMTDLTPTEAIYVADKAARHAGDLINNPPLRKTS